jgi:hypothetical protein
MSRSIIIAGFLGIALIAAPAPAWHEVGHIMTALVAYKQLSPGDAPSTAVKKLVEILKHHPRFQEDFASAMPNGLSEADATRWLFCRAAVWPDKIREDHANPASFPPNPQREGSYNRPQWHYIDTPLLILSSEAGAERAKDLEATARAGLNLSADAPAAEANVGNVLQAIAFNRLILERSRRSDQAVALCWLLHTMGDIHQPLHAASAYSTRIFQPGKNPNGDAGGNLIKLSRGGNLHSLWDAAAADEEVVYDSTKSFNERYELSYSRAEKLAAQILADRKYLSQGSLAGREKDVRQWARESFELDKEKVYAAEVRNAILNARSVRFSVKLPHGYRAQAHEIAKLRVVQAGFRMAEFFRTQAVGDGAAKADDAKTVDAKESLAETERLKSAPTKPVEYLSSARSQVFHKADCPAAAKISPGNLVHYATRDEAIRAGKRPCKECNP